MKLFSKSIALVFAAFFIYSSASSAESWAFKRWKKKYPHYARGEAGGEDYGYVQRVAAARGAQRCIDVGGGTPYGENYYHCYNEGRVSVYIRCFAYVPCNQ
jgi:hypothetical protein